MPTQSPQWTEFLSCPVCFNVFNERLYRPISLACGHTVCKLCLGKLHQKKCPFDQSLITRSVEDLPVNFALLQLVGVAVPEEPLSSPELAKYATYYQSTKRCIEELAILLKPVSVSPGGSNGNTCTALSRPIQRKLVALVSCQLVEEEGRARAVRAARSLGERTVTEMILQHQNSQQLSANLWAAVRARGCQFLGPAMQEEVLKLILLALEDGSALSRKVLVLFVVQRLASQYPQASKTAIGHVVQLLYRASCFKVTKREEESSLMQLKDEFRTYEALRREHDSQIVQIATEAGLRISPEQWSSLLYGDTAHKSHMQSIIDKLQTPQSFVQSVNELVVALQRNGDPGNLSRLRPHYELLANVDPSPDTPPPSWENLEAVMKAVKTVVQGLVEFCDNSSGQRRTEPLLAQGNSKYKTHMCRDLAQKGRCPRGNTCTFAHSQEEMERYRARSKRLGKTGVGTPIKVVTSSALSPSEHQQLAAVAKATQEKMLALAVNNEVSHHRMREVMLHHPEQGISRMGVSVPVMKPSVLPASAKNSGIRQAIYTSPTALTDEESYRTELLPITSMVPAMPPPPVKSVYGNSGVLLAASRKPAQHLTGVPATPAVNPTSYTEHGAFLPGIPSRQASIVPQSTTHANPVHCTMTTAGVKVENDRRIFTPNEQMMRNTVSFPANPYTSETADIPTPDSHYYLTTNVVKYTRGKSPSQQLGELHQRRSDLIAQLTKSKNSAEGSVSPQPSPPVAEVKPRCAVSDRMDQHYAAALSKSVADTLATALCTMSVATPQVAPPHKEKTAQIGYGHGYGGTTIENVKWSVDDGTHDDKEFHHIPQAEGGYVLSDEDKQDSWTSNGYSYEDADEQYWKEDEESFADYKCLFQEVDDEFVPFEHSVVSKYGPISRMAKAKLKSSGPLQVTAAQTDGVTAVTAVTPIKRPVPISQQVPSRFQQGRSRTQNEESTSVLPNPMAFPVSPEQMQGIAHDHTADPRGRIVATSLPTALMQPNLIAVANNMEPQTLWNLKERLGGDLNVSNSTSSSCPKVISLSGKASVIDVSGCGNGEIRQELRKLNERIEGLQSSEEERLVRELQAIELNIQETQRKIGQDGTQVREAEKRAQVEQDRRLAQQIVLREARQKGFIQEE